MNLPNPMILKAFARQAYVQNSSEIDAPRFQVNVLHSYSKSRYELGQMVKRTIYGAVFHAVVLRQLTDTDTTVFLRTEQEVAVKVFSKSRVLSHLTKSKEQPLNEIAVLQYIGNNHPSIMGQIECCADDDYIYLIMKWIPEGELFDYIASHGRMAEDEARNFFHSLLSALLRLQERQIGHRDISLENILYNPLTKQTILIDFGMSVHLPQRNYSNKRGILDTKNIHGGKVHYMPPEVMKNDEFVDPLAGDLWSAAICLLYCLLGFPPMERASLEDPRYEMIVTGRLQELLTHWHATEHVSEDVIDLLTMILKEDARDRPSLRTVMNHRWMMQGSRKMEVVGVGSMMEEMRVLQREEESASMYAQQVQASG